MSLAMSSPPQNWRDRLALALRRVAERLSPLPAAAVPPELAARQPYAKDGWDHIPQGQYDYVPKGTYVSGPADRFLLVPTNRYRAVLLPDQPRSTELGVGWVTEDNSPEGYDLLWGDAAQVEAFRAEAGHVRDKLTLEIVDHLESRLPRQGAVVDIGCGVGDLLLEVLRRRPSLRVAGLDFSGKAVEGARAAMPAGEFQRFTIARTLPYASASFDAVLCTDVLEHLEYPRAVAAELVRICKPGGVVAIVVPDGDVDQFFGHWWFWNERSLAALLAEWAPVVTRLPQTREFIAVITVPQGA
jgi:SAM-dependent methyltransferase